MKLLCISDIHGRDDVLREILAHGGPADAVVLAGDLTDFGTPADAQRIVETAQESGVPVVAVAGNCDSRQIEQRLAELAVSLMRRSIRLHEFAFHGLSAMPPWHGTMYELTEAELAEALAEGYQAMADTPPQRQVLVSHAPPRGCRLDRTRRGDQAGSQAVREWIDARQPMLVVCGHIHEARGVETIGGTTVVNCGLGAGGQYAVARLADDTAAAVELRQV